MQRLIIAATVGIAGLLQLLILLLRRGGSLATPLRISFDADMRGFLGKAIPGMIASSGPQLLDRRPARSSRRHRRRRCRGCISPTA